MRQSVLFYSFIVIFLATATVTLLGVTGVLDIPAAQLNLLLGAFLVELAAAVIALFKRTDFFRPPPDNLASALGSTIEAFDQVSDEIKAAIKAEPPEPGHVHRFLIRRMGDRVVAYERMQVISAEDLDQLPKDQRDLIRTYERSMKQFMSAWKNIKGSGEAQLDPATRDRQIQLLRGMKSDLVGVLDFLQSRGIWLDDHYLEVRHLVSEL